MSVYLEKNKILFVHIPKTAGASIRKSLSLIEKIYVVPNDKTIQNWHSTYMDCSYHLANIVDELYKFTIVRNPWDRATSWYSFRKNIINGELAKVKEGKSKKLENNFPKIQKELELMNKGFSHWIEQYIYEPWDRTWFSLSHTQSFWLKGGQFNSIVKFENLYEELKKLSFIDIDNLQHKHKTINSLCDYKIFYNDNSKNLIKKIYEEDIDKFQYTF